MQSISVISTTDGIPMNLAPLTGIIILSGIGYFLDQWRGSFPLYFTIGLVLGIIIGIYEMGRLILRGK